MALVLADAADAFALHFVGCDTRAHRVEGGGKAFQMHSQAVAF